MKEISEEIKQKLFKALDGKNGSELTIQECKRACTMYNLTPDELYKIIQQWANTRNVTLETK